MKKILVRMPQWLGDVVVSTIFLIRLKNKEPDSEIDVWIKAPLGPLVESHPDVDRVIHLPPKSAASVFKAADFVRSNGYDALYVIPRSARSALEACLTKIPNRIGFKGGVRSVFFTKAVPYDQSKKYPEKISALLGPVPANGPLIPFFPVTETTWEKIAAQLGAEPSTVKKPILGLAPYSIAPARTWPKEKYADLAKRFLSKTRGTVFLIGAKSEKAQLQAVADDIRTSVIVNAGALDFPHLGWVMKQLHYFVGNDSGLMHAASAFQIPSTIIFGASDPQTALPAVDGMSAIQNKNIFCVPCLRNDCVRFGSQRNECLRTIAVDQVWA